MPECVLRISEDKAFIRAETPDANWEPKQVSDDGLNILSDSETPNDPMYLVVTDGYEGDDGLSANTIYMLVPLKTKVIENWDMEQEPPETPEPTDV